MRLLKPAFTSFVRNKKLLLYVLSITITLGLLMVMLDFNILVKKFYKDEIENNIKNRVLFVSADNVNNINLSDITSIDNIEKVQYNFKPIIVNFVGQNLNIQTNIMLDESQIIYGRACQDNNIEMVIPSSLESAINLLDKYIEIQYGDLILNIKIVGIYNDYTKQKYSYISSEAVQYFTKHDESIISYSTCLAVVNKYENLENVTFQLKKKNFNANLYDTSGLNDIKTYKTISIIFSLAICIIVLFIYITLAILVSNIFNDEKKDIAILKALGYNLFDTLKIVFYRLLAIVLVSFGFGILIQKFLEIILNHNIVQIINSNCNLNLNFIYYIVILLLLICLVTIISVKSLKKIKLIDTIILLKE